MPSRLRGNVMVKVATQHFNRVLAEATTYTEVEFQLAERTSQL